MTNRKSLIKRAADGLAKQFGYVPSSLKVVQTSAPTPFQQLMKFFGFSYSFATWEMNEFIKDGYTGNAILYSIISRITETAALPEFHVYRIKDQQKHRKYKAWTGRHATKDSLLSAMMIKNQAYEEDSSHPLNALLEKPNQWQGRNEFTQTAVGFKLITGNRFLYVVSLDAGADRGKPFGIWNLPPQHMRIVAGKGLWTVDGYELNLGTLVKIPKEYVIHSRYFNPVYDTMGSHLWGLSPLKAASQTIQRGNKAEERGVNMLNNAGAAGVLFNKLATMDEMNDPGVKELKEKLNREILGTDNAGQIALANGDLGWINFGQTAVEMELLAQEQAIQERLCNVYRVPAGLFLANANATDNNILAWNRQLITQAVIPAINDLRDDWNQIAQAYGDQIYVDYELECFPELQEDREKLANWLSKAWWIKGNEKRIAMDYDEDMDEPMMNQYLVPTNVQPISNINPDLLMNDLNAVDGANTGDSGGDVSNP